MAVDQVLAYRNQLLSVLGISDNSKYSVSDLEFMVFNKTSLEKESGDIPSSLPSSVSKVDADNSYASLTGSVKSTINSFGVNDHPLSSSSPGGPGLIAATGAKWVRVDFQWSSIQSNSYASANTAINMAGTLNSGSVSNTASQTASAAWYTLSFLQAAQAYVALARSTGLSVLFTFNGPIPSYTSASGTVDFQNLCEFLATQFIGQYDIEWEIWNEPNVNAPFNGVGNAALFAAFSEAGVAGFRFVDPSIRVGTLCISSSITSDVTAGATYYTAAIAGGLIPKNYDWISYHPYINTHPSSTPSGNTFVSGILVLGCLSGTGTGTFAVSGTLPSWPAKDTTGATQSQFILKLSGNNEEVLVYRSNLTSNTTLTVLARGVNSTAAAAHTTDEVVTLIYPAPLDVPIETQLISMWGQLRAAMLAAGDTSLVYCTEFGFSYNNAGLTGPYTTSAVNAAQQAAWTRRQIAYQNALGYVPVQMIYALRDYGTSTYDGIYDDNYVAKPVVGVIETLYRPPQPLVPGFGFPCSVDPGQLRVSDALSVGTINNAIYLRCLEGGVVSHIALQIAVQSGNICIGVYRNSGQGRSAVPGTRIASSGAIACPAVGYQDIALGSTVLMQPGDWLAISADNTTATFRCAISSAGASNLGLGRQYIQTTAHPLPTTPASLSATVGNNIVLLGAAV